MLNEIKTAVDLYHSVKDQAEHLKSLTEKIEKSTEILQAKTIAFDEIKR